MRLEFKLLAKVMSESLPPIYPYSLEGVDSAIKTEDFDDRVDVLPVSNPNVFSQAQRIALAQTKLQLAGAAPEIHNMYEVYHDMYEALGVKDVDRILRQVPKTEDEPLDPAQENINALDMAQLKAFVGQDHRSHIMAHLVFGSSPMAMQLPPVAMALQKHVMEHVKIQSEEQAMAMAQQQGIQDSMQIEMLKAQMIAQGMQEVKQMSQQVSGQGPDPLVKLKEQELQLRAQSEQNDAQLDQAKLGLEQQSLAQRDRQFNQRLQSQESQTAARIQSAMDRERMKQRGQ